MQTTKSDVEVIRHKFTLQAQTPQNGQTHSNTLTPTICLSVWPFSGVGTLKVRASFLTNNKVISICNKRHKLILRSSIRYLDIRLSHLATSKMTSAPHHLFRSARFCHPTLIFPLNYSHVFDKEAYNLRSRFHTRIGHVWLFLPWVTRPKLHMSENKLYFFSISFFNPNKANIRRTYEISSKLTIKAQGRCWWSWA